MKSQPILVVEDDDAIREVLKEILEIEGYSVVLAKNGKEALDYLLKELNPGWIILDLMMPVMNGNEFLEKFHQNSQWKNIKVTILSADRQIEQKSQLLGAISYLKKPVELEDLLRELEKTDKMLKAV